MDEKGQHKYEGHEWIRMVKVVQGSFVTRAANLRALNKEKLFW